jgi:hypothetical protein
MSGEMSVSCLWEAILSSLIISLNELMICVFSIGIDWNIFNEKIESSNVIKPQRTWRNKKEEWRRDLRIGGNYLDFLNWDLSCSMESVDCLLKLRGCSWLSWIILNHGVYLYESHRITLNTLVFFPVFYNQYILYIIHHTSHNIWLWALILDT